MFIRNIIPLRTRINHLGVNTLGVGAFGGPSFTGAPVPVISMALAGDTKLFALLYNNKIVMSPGAEIGLIYNLEL